MPSQEVFELRFAKIPDEPPPPPKDSSSDDSGTEGSDESSSGEEEDSESEDKRAVQLRYLEKQVCVCVWGVWGVRGGVSVWCGCTYGLSSVQSAQ